MINKKKLYSITLASTALILMLMNVAGATPYIYVSNLGSNNVSVINTTSNIVTTIVNVGKASTAVGEFISTFWKAPYDLK